MAFSAVQNVSLRGVAACVPKEILENRSMSFFSGNEADKFIASTGVERKRICGPETCTSDLCCHAAEKLINDLSWQKSDIDCLVFVSQTPDYDLPATSCILQNRLGLGNDVIALDISSGCSGWVYGLYVLSSLLSSGIQKKGLLLVGDTSLKFCSENDKGTYPLFGDAGTATALEYNSESDGFKFHLGTDGSRYETIIIPEGGYRSMITPSSFEPAARDQAMKHPAGKILMDGMNVFSFGIVKAPESVNSLLAHFNISSDDIDYFLFHQANMFLNEKIRKKLNLGSDKVPYSLRDFGNTSSASIPLTMAVNCDGLTDSGRQIVACGFGVGLSWGSVYIKTERMICSGLTEI